MQHIVPSSQATAVLPLLVKLMYLEAQPTEAGASAAAAAAAKVEAMTDSWDAAAL